MFPPSVNCKITGGLLSVHVSACGFCPEVGLAMYLNYFGGNSDRGLTDCCDKNAEINEKYLKESPKDIFMGNVYNYDAIYDVKSFILDFSQQTYMGIDPRSVTVIVKYSYAEDMKAEDLEIRVNLPPETALSAAVQNNSAYPYEQTTFG